MRQLSLLIGISLFVLQGCSNTTEPDDGFVAERADFSSYNSWEMIDYNVAEHPVLGPAHAGNDPDFARAVYANNSRNGDGTYPEETIIVKEVFTFDENGEKQYASSAGLTAMVKRGGEFNAENGGWEYFLLDPQTQAISGRGADLNNGGCQNCHASATGDQGADFVFNHPMSYEAILPDDFENWTSWIKVDSTRGPDPAGFLTGAHAGDNTDVDRVVYANSMAANPIGGVYPTGTIIVKELRDKDSGNLTGALTMLVKRGGDYNPDGNSWEWMMTSTDLQTVMAQGGNNDQSTEGCVSCHAQANSSDNGADWVFSHPRE